MAESDVHGGATHRSFSIEKGQSHHVNGWRFADPKWKKWVNIEKTTMHRTGRKVLRLGWCVINQEPSYFSELLQRSLNTTSIKVPWFGLVAWNHVFSATSSPQISGEPPICQNVWKFLERSNSVQQMWPRKAHVSTLHDVARRDLFRVKSCQRSGIECCREVSTAVTFSKKRLGQIQNTLFVSFKEVKFTRTRTD